MKIILVGIHPLSLTGWILMTPTRAAQNRPIFRWLPRWHHNGVSSKITGGRRKLRNGRNNLSEDVEIFHTPSPSQAKNIDTYLCLLHTINKRQRS